MKLLKMTTIFTIVGLLTAVAIGAADSSEDMDRTLSPYFLVKSVDPDVDQLPLLTTSAEVNIAGVIADVTVTQIYKNEGTHPLEAIYVFPASTRAAVYGMTMTIGERTIFAQIRERQQARQEYEQAKQEGKTASLLEQQRPNVFQMNVANILSGDTIKVELQYTELLVPTNGVYEFVYPTVVGPRYSSQQGVGAPDSDKWVANPYLHEEEGAPYIFDITTHLSTGIPIQEISSPSHQVDISYEGPGSASATLNEDMIIERIRMLKPDHLERLKNALKELYVGDDFANLPVFYTKLFHLVTGDSRQTEEVAERQTIKKFSGDRDYILRYRLAGGKIDSGLLLYQGENSKTGGMPGNQEDENFFLLMVQPPERVTPETIPPREYIFIVDVSGSMNGFPLTISKQLLRDLMIALRPTDRFNVLLFAGGSTVMSEESVPVTQKNIERALRIIDKEKGGGGTELLPALRQALALPENEGTSRTIVIATDGLVKIETEAFEFIRRNLNNANVFAFGIGSSVNRFLIEGMARAGLGEPFIVTKPDKAAGQAKKFREYIQAPVLTEMSADFGQFEVYDVEPLSIPDVLAERPVLLFGKWRGKTEGMISVSGFSGKGGYRQTFQINNIKPRDTNSALRYLWARKRIEILGDYNQLQANDERKQEITDLGLTYNLLTAYTSFVAIDSKVRRKKDELATVQQPVPLPQGVSGNAVSGGGQRYRGRNGGSTVPEPDTLLLVAAALLMLVRAFFRRKQRCKKM